MTVDISFKRDIESFLLKLLTCLHWIGCISHCSAIASRLGRYLGIIVYQAIKKGGIIFNTVKNTDAAVSIKLIQKCCIEGMYYSTQHLPPEVSLSWWNRQLS